jgi:hypothetical protein
MVWITLVPDRTCQVIITSGPAGDREVTAGDT